MANLFQAAFAVDPGKTDIIKNKLKIIGKLIIAKYLCKFSLWFSCCFVLDSGEICDCSHAIENLLW